MFVQKEKNNYQPYLDKLNNKIYDSQTDSFFQGSNFRCYKSYTKNGLYEKINTALRYGYTDDYSVGIYIQQLDQLFNSIPDKLRNRREMNVYRGVIPCSDLQKIISGKSDSCIYLDKGFISTSKNKLVAKQFALDESGVILDIVIPPNSLILDDESLPSYLRSQMKNEQEVLLPRNSEFQILDYDKDSKVVKALYLGQRKPLEMPVFCESSGYDILSDLNKNTLNLNFDNYKSFK